LTPEKAMPMSGGDLRRSLDVSRLSCLPFGGLLLLGAALAAGPVLAKVTGVPETVAVVTPALSSVTTSRAGCTPLNPCAIVTPALGNAPLPTPETPAQPDLPATTDAPAANAPAAPSPARTAAASPNCPPAGARGAFARGQFAGRAGQPGQGRGEGSRGFGGRNGGAGRGAGTGGAMAAGGRGGQQFSQNPGRGQGFGSGNFARGGDPCPPLPAGRGRGGDAPSAPRP
jgi:translation initiation factor IF-2